MGSRRSVTNGEQLPFPVPLVPAPGGWPTDLDSVPTMGLLCELLNRWGAEKVLRYVGLPGVEQLLDFARQADAGPVAAS